MTEKSGIRILPPIIFALAMVVAFIIKAIWPLALLPNFWQYICGAVIFGVSFLLVPSIFNKFKAAKTTLDVRNIPTSLLTDGAFAYSRNPIYLSMIGLCIGIGVFFDNIYVLPALVLAVVYLTFRVIHIEEKLLESEFGQEYLDYKSRVRRWI